MYIVKRKSKRKSKEFTEVPLDFNQLALLLTQALRLKQPKQPKGIAKYEY